jgi:hypothetical protein
VEASTGDLTCENVELVMEREHSQPLLLPYFERR